MDMTRDDIVSAQGIKPFLVFPEVVENILVFSELDSTNREAKARAVDGARYGTVVIADHQTSGRGRFSRGFFSPRGSGLYISFVLHCGQLGFSNPTAITAYAGLCVCEAVESLCGFSPSIKWVNDVYLDGKKICGILTEGITDFESGGIGEIVLGIGINVSTRTEDFPEEIRERAGSLFPDGRPLVTRNRLAAEVINRVLGSGDVSEAELFTRYKRRLFMLGADVTVVQGNEEYKARALDIDGCGGLVVEKADGSIVVLSSGEISIR